MAWLAVMEITEEGRIAKYQPFERLDEAEAHIARHVVRYPAAFVVEHSHPYIADMKVDTEGNVTVEPIVKVPQRRYVPKYTIVSRLDEMEKFDAVMAVFDQLPRFTRERWAAAVDIWAEDPETLAVLQAAGLTPEQIETVLAPG